MTQLDYFTVKLELYFGIICGQIMVVPPVDAKFKKNENIIGKVIGRVYTHNGEMLLT